MFTSHFPQALILLVSIAGWLLPFTAGVSLGDAWRHSSDRAMLRRDTNVSLDDGLTANADPRTICVHPSRDIPSWIGTPLTIRDCKDAWNTLIKRVGPQIGQPRPFTYWFEAPAPRTPLNHQTPFGEIVGTCHVAIVMIASIPPRDENDKKVLPDRLIQHWLDRPHVDRATFGDIDDAVSRVGHCLTAFGTPGAWAAGQFEGLEGIGVFFWSSDSRISLGYRKRKPVRGAIGNDTSIYEPIGTVYAGQVHTS